MLLGRGADEAFLRAQLIEALGARSQTFASYTPPHEGLYHEGRDKFPIISTQFRRIRRSRRAQNKAQNIATVEQVEHVGNVDNIDTLNVGTVNGGTLQQQSNAELSKQLSQLVETLQRAVDSGGSGKASRSSHGAASWNSRMGPEKGSDI